MRKSIVFISVCFLFVLLFNACGDTGSSQQAVTAPVPTVKAQPTKPESGTTGPAILGATLAAFIAKYGPLNQFSQPSNDQYYFSIYGNNKDDITVFMLDGKHVDGVIYAAPDSNKGWDKSTAIATCLTLLPSDAKYKRQMTQGDQDIQRVYSSAALASLFPASDFTDENGSQAAPGTIGLILDYNGNSTTSFIDCVVQVGLQS